MAENVSITMPDELVRPIIEAKVAAAICAAMGDSDAIITQMVSLALSQKVGHDGNKAQYSSDNKYTFIEAMCNKTIQDYARTALVKWLGESRGKIEAAIKKHFDRKSNELAASIVGALIERTNLNVEFEAKAKFKSDYR